MLFAIPLSALSNLIPDASLIVEAAYSNKIPQPGLSTEYFGEIKPRLVRSGQLKFCLFHVVRLARANKKKGFRGISVFVKTRSRRGSSGTRSQTNVAHVTSYSRIGLAPTRRADHELPLALQQPAKLSAILQV